MLLELKIKNFVIIDNLTISFEKGLNILTGETGAGKSILIDALAGILGDKMTTDMIRTGFEKATLEGLFDIESIPQIKNILETSGIDFDDETLIVRRELYATGRGRCFVNSTHVSVAKLKELAEYLIDIHGQNAHQGIINTAKHRELLDSFAGNNSLVNDIKELHSKLTDIKNKIDSIGIDEKEKARKIEYNTFIINEIESANLNANEEEELVNQSTILSNAEKLFQEINFTARLVNNEDGILNKIKKAASSLSAVSEYDINISNTLDSMKEVLYSLEDISQFLSNYEDNLDYSPEKINEVESRLSLISSLKRKYGDNIPEILSYLDNAKKELETITSHEEVAEQYQNNYKKYIKEAKEIALELSEDRKIAALKLENLVMQELNDLGMAGTIFRVSIKREISPDGEIETKENKYILYPHGLDKVEFLLATNKGEDLRQLKRVASGGEMSRIMLALKNVILASDIVDSLIFDEVDAGISGKVAEIVGKKLKVLAKDRQVLVITHLPQIAAMADTNFLVEKKVTDERITTSIKKLNKKDKILEVGRLLAGEKITDLSLKHAEEMIAIAKDI